MKENEMVFGIRAVIEAVQADKEIDKILVKRELQGDLSRELFEILKGRDIPVQRVPAERLDRLTRKKPLFRLLRTNGWKILFRLYMNKEKIRLSCCWTGLRMSVTSERLPVPANVPVWMRS